jgi:hypothetical protein
VPLIQIKREIFHAASPALQPAPCITSKKPVPPASVPESAASSLSALQNAAEDGDPIAQWQLGRMYAEGNGVAQNDLLAFDYFSRIANAHGKDSPSAPEAQMLFNGEQVRVAYCALVASAWLDTLDKKWPKACHFKPPRHPSASIVGRLYPPKAGGLCRQWGIGSTQIGALAVQQSNVTAVAIGSAQPTSGTA